MKKFILILTIAFSFLWQGAGSQNLIAVQNGGTPEFYTKLDSALVHAQNADTIYIPGGIYLSNSNLIIDKELHFIGVGHHPDSTAANHLTYLWTTITLVDGSSNSTFEGFYLTDNIAIGVSNGTPADVDNIEISRCNIASILLGQNSSNWVILENVVRADIQNISSGSFTQNILISNNILCAGVHFFSNSQFANNIFIKGYGWYYLSSINECEFRNNIFWDGIGINIIGCVFDNNILFNGGCSFLTNGNLGFNNICNPDQNNIFISYPGSSFDYSYNFHLQPTCPGTNAGKDGTDIGIYGGAFPWKDGSIPFNPHFQAAQIAPTTDSTGNLNVNIKVAAQDR